MARDTAIQRLEDYRAHLVSVGRTIAVALAHQYGSVTSVMVREEMVRQGSWDAKVDPRWMGAIFRSKQPDSGRWVRDGWVLTGSHARPVAKWKRVLGG